MGYIVQYVESVLILLLVVILSVFKFFLVLPDVFCPSIQSRMLRYILLSGLVRLLLAVAASNTLLVFDDLESLRRVVMHYVGRHSVGFCLMFFS